MKNNYDKLVDEARKAIQKGFYAKSDQVVKYGAAVLTNKGNIYSSGQYSSFNHITSIHAEMGAVLLATMNNDSGVIALALAGENTVNICCCGACLQFLKEHYNRTGLDMDLVFVKGNSYKVVKLTELIEYLW